MIITNISIFEYQSRNTCSNINKFLFKSVVLKLQVMTMKKANEDISNSNRPIIQN